MEMEIAKRVASMQFSPIRKFNKYGFEAEANGKTCLLYTSDAADE